MNKLERLQNYIPKHQNGAKLKTVELTDTPNVVPTGDLHAHKHEDFDLDVTKKGIPVITVQDDSVETLPEIQRQSDTLVQHAEIQKEEIILNKELTEIVEKAREKWNETKDDSICIEIGKKIVKEVLFNTTDNSGLIEKVADKV